MRLVLTKKKLTWTENTNMYRLLLSLFFFCFAASAYAVPGQITVLHSRSVQKDSSTLLLRKFDESKLASYQKDSSFQYSDTVPDNTWERFWRWFWNLVNGVLKNPYSGGFLKYVVIGILSAGLIFIVIKFLGLDMKIFLGKSKSIALPFSESLENIHGINFNDEIEKAIVNSNYRLAVRLYYLHTLKRLNDQSLISWQPEKTNHTYIGEIEDPSLKLKFSRLTTQFEYIWYGEFAIDKENFGSIQSDFMQFNTSGR